MKEADARKTPAIPEGSHSECGAPEAQAAVWALLDEWNAGEPPPGFDAAVLARVRAEEGSPSERGWFEGLLDWFRGMDSVRGFGLAGAVATVVFAVVMMREPTATPEIPPSQASVQELSAQQVELALEDLRMLDELYSAPAPEENQDKKI